MSTSAAFDSCACTCVSGTSSHASFGVLSVAGVSGLAHHMSCALSAPPAVAYALQHNEHARSIAAEKNAEVAMCVLWRCRSQLEEVGIIVHEKSGAFSLTLVIGLESAARGGERAALVAGQLFLTLGFTIGREPTNRREIDRTRANRERGVRERESSRVTAIATAGHQQQQQTDRDGIVFRWCVWLEEAVDARRAKQTDCRHACVHADEPLGGASPAVSDSDSGAETKKAARKRKLSKSARKKSKKKSKKSKVVDDSDESEGEKRVKSEFIEDEASESDEDGGSGGAVKSEDDSDDEDDGEDKNEYENDGFVVDDLDDDEESDDDAGTLLAALKALNCVVTSVC
ncbi:hypothetical protein PybrP1_009430 [[Pythium] brassicae (nom. inval.)]|nr:hypothetical protein PybrP1_009430 [[Pythium] brassicae (nom. inval.)]